MLIWVGRTNDAKVKPFIIQGDNVYFNGRVNFSNIQGAGELASMDALAYADLWGSKPPVDADKTPLVTIQDAAAATRGRLELRHHHHYRRADDSHRYCLRGYPGDQG